MGYKTDPIFFIFFSKSASHAPKNRGLGGLIWGRLNVNEPIDEGFGMNRGYCRSCKKITRAVKAGGTNHILHAILSLFTAGFWLPVWALIALSSKAEPICNDCGKKLISEDKAPKPTKGPVKAPANERDPCPCGSGRKYLNCHGLQA